MQKISCLLEQENEYRENVRTTQRKLETQCHQSTAHQNSAGGILGDPCWVSGVPFADSGGSRLVIHTGLRICQAFFNMMRWLFVLNPFLS